ncbi:MAG: hypothetical protein RLZZ69_2760 [Cyanobacteriota bacterium]
MPGLRNLTNDERQAVYEMVLSKSVHGKPAKGSFTDTAAHFKVHPLTVSRIWKVGQKSIAEGSICANVSSKKKDKCGRKATEIDLEDVKTVPLSQRSTLRSLSAAISIPKSTLHRKFKQGQLRRHSNAIKPLLTETNKSQRTEFALSLLVPGINPPVFQEMFDCVHVDEKWFYLTKTKATYYLCPDEPEPLRTCKSKRFIEKVMFLAAVARPRFDHSRKKFFDGKVGIWPFVIQEPAQRNSKNREAGTLVTKPINVTKEVYCDFLINKVLPAIRQKWPRRNAGAPIYIQQDNAKPHIRSDDPAFVEAARLEGFDIRLRCQPPNSPDTNVLDLGFFNSIQALQHQCSARTIDDLIAATEKAFTDLDETKLNYVFLTLQQCLKCIIETKGGNHYKIPHMGKDRLERADMLTMSISVAPEVVARARDPLNL